MAKGKLSGMQGSGMQRTTKRKKEEEQEQQKQQPKQEQPRPAAKQSKASEPAASAQKTETGSKAKSTGSQQTWQRRAPMRYQRPERSTVDALHETIGLTNEPEKLPNYISSGKEPAKPEKLPYRPAESTATVKPLSYSPYAGTAADVRQFTDSGSGTVKKPEAKPEEKSGFAAFSQDEEADAGVEEQPDEPKQTGASPTNTALDDYLSEQKALREASDPERKALENAATEAQAAFEKLDSQDKTWWGPMDWDSYNRAQAEAAQANKALADYKPFTDWGGRSALIDELNEIDNNSGFITNEAEANAAEARREEIIDQLTAGDEAAGNAPTTYTDNGRARDTFTGATNQYLSGAVNALGTAVRGMGELGENAGNASQYAGYATDEMSAAAIGNGTDEERQAWADEMQRAQGFGDTVQQAADSLGEEAAKDLAQAKAGLGRLGQAGVDIATNVIQMGYDAGLGGLWAMFLRSAGASAQEARQDGATTGQQIAYGLTKGGIEVATEKLFDGVAGIFGKGAADDVVEGVIRKLTGSDTGRTILRAIAGAGGEGAEEVISDILSPFAEKIYKNESLRELFGSVNGSDVLYDFLIGAAIGGLGGGTSIATGQNAAKNAAAREADAASARVNEQMEGVMDALANPNAGQETAAPLDPTQVLAEQVTGQAAPVEGPSAEDQRAEQRAQRVEEILTTPTEEAAEAPQEAAELPGDIPAPPTAAESSTGESQAFNSWVMNSDEGIGPEAASGTHIDERGSIDLGSRSVKAFQQENPEVQPYYKKAAEVLAQDLQYSLLSDAKGVRKGGGTQISASNLVRDYMARYGLTRKQMLDGCNRIIHDEGQENVAVAKRVELMLDEMLTNGYEPADATIPKFARDSDYVAEKARLGGETEESYRIRQAVQTEIDVAALDGETLTPGEAEAIVRARFEKTGYYSLGEELGGPDVDSRRTNARDQEEFTHGQESYIMGQKEEAADNGGRVEEGNPVLDSEAVEAEKAGTGAASDVGDGAVQLHRQNNIPAQQWGNLSEEQRGNAQSAINEAARQELGEDARTMIEGWGENAAEALYRTYYEEGPEAFAELCSYMKEDPDTVIGILNDAVNGNTGAVENEDTGIPAAERITEPAGENDNNGTPPTPPASPTQTSEIVPVENEGTPPAPPGSGGGGLTQPGTPAQKRSQTESNTLSGVAEKLGGEQEELYYVPIPERQTITEAVNRVKADMNGEMQGLMDKDMWTAADIDTGMTIYGILKADAVRTGDNSAANAWAKIVQSRGTKSGQALQAFSKWTRSAAGQATYAADIIDQADNLSPEEKSRITNDLYDFASQMDAVEDGDTTAIREIILKLNQYRGTGTFIKGNFEKMLNEVEDFDWLREYAQRQLMSVASDATNDASLGQKLKTWQVNAQLTRLGTFFRNIGGNVLFGVQDTLTQDGLGVALDWLASKATGKREVGLDRSWFSSKARNGAHDAMIRSILEVAGDVSMNGEGSKYGTTSNRTFKMNGGGFERFMSRWEQLLGYSLTTSDRTSRGSIEAAIGESLANFDLTDEERSAIAEGTADYRLFQNKGTAYKMSKGLHDLLNYIGIGGTVNGPLRQGGFGAGDMLNPYPGVPANLAVKALEYSPANIIKGGIEFGKVLKSIKGGTYEAGKQNQAVMDMARGMAGVPIIALLAAAFRTGIVRNSDDEEDKDAKFQNRAEGKSGVQINLDAWMRAMNGESAAWRDGDDLMSIGWLEPMNAFMAIASMVAEEDEATLGAYSSDLFNGALQGVLEMPVMGNIKNVFDSFQYSTGETPGEKIKDAAIGLVGDAVSGMLPAPAGQTAKTGDLYFRDTKGDTKLEQVINNLVSNIPGLRETLPEQTDVFGNPREYSDSALQRFLNNFVLPGAINELNQTETSAALEQLYVDTGEASVYPDRKAPTSFTYGGEKIKLDTGEQRAWHETYGRICEENIGELLTSGKYDDYSDQQKVDMISKVKEYANYVAKKEYFETTGGTYTNKEWDKVQEVLDTGVNLVDYLSGKKSANVNRDANLSNDELYDWLSSSDYTDEQKAALWDANKGNSNKSWQDYNSGRPETIIAGTGKTPEEAKEIADAIDAMDKANGSITQAEIEAYYKNHKGDEDMLRALWDALGNANGWKTSFDKGVKK